MIKRLGFLICFCWTFWGYKVCTALEDPNAISAAAGGSGSSLMLPTFLDVLLLAGTFSCFLISVKVKSFLKDGELAAGWTLLSVSFVLLFVAQLLSLFLVIGLFSIAPNIISSLRVLFILLLGSGIYFMKKVLS
jgi:hypothetical protein